MLKNEHIKHLRFFERFDAKKISELSAHAFDIRVSIKGAVDVIYIFSRSLSGSQGLVVSPSQDGETTVHWNEDHSEMGGEQALDMIVHIVGIMSQKPAFHMEIVRINMAFETSDGKRTAVTFI